MAINLKKATTLAGLTNPILAPYSANQLLTDANKVATTSKKKTTTYSSPIGPNPAPTLKSYAGSGSGGSGGGGVSVASSYATTVRPYLDEMLAAYRQGADANKALAKATYDAKVNNLNSVLRQAEEDYASTESDLLTSLKRYQEQNAKSLENQRKSYLTDQAALESARLEADRQTRIDAAARGLGGSGLQQLAQLQNLLNQGQDISDLATSNQDVLDELRTQLTQQTEDINTKKERARKVLEAARTANQTGLTDLLNAYNAEVQGIDANLANQVANAQYTYGENLYSANQAEAARAAARAASSNSTLLALLDQTQEDAISGIGDIANASDKEFKSLAKNYYGDAYSKSITKKQMLNDYISDTLNSAVQSGVDQNQRNTLKSNLNSYLKYYGY